MRTNLALGLVQGLLRAAPATEPAWLADLGTDFGKGEGPWLVATRCRHRRWAANAATVSPAPDTGRQVPSNRREPQTMPHRSHEWPWTPAQPRLASAVRTASQSMIRFRPLSGTRERRTTCLTPTPWGAGGRALRLWRFRGCFPVRQHIEASKAIARLHKLDPERISSSSTVEKRLPPGRFITMSSPSRTQALFRA